MAHFTGTPLTMEVNMNSVNSKLTPRLFLMRSMVFAARSLVVASSSVRMVLPIASLVKAS